MKVVQVSRNAKEVDDALHKMRDETQLISDYLMSAEMVIVEQFEEVIKEFERNYTELCATINEFGQSSFARLRDLENEHQEKFTETIVAMFERFNKGDMDEVDDEIRDVNLYLRIPTSYWNSHLSTSLCRLWVTRTC